eukprot:scaffold45921_cov50-Phaeocystis_antarctica.AAC.1
MDALFRVRSSPCPAPSLQSRPLLHAACVAAASHLPPSRAAPLPASHARLSTLGRMRMRSTSR